MTENEPSEPKDPQARPHSASNDNGARGAPIDPRILFIARALGRQIAREYLKRLRAANDNEPAKKR
jgi:hypothetical protein